MSWTAPAVLAASLALAAAAPPVVASPVVAPPPDAALPREVSLQDAEGRMIATDELLGAPLVLAPVSFRCPDLCGVTQRWLADALRRSRAAAGRDYRLAILSFDPRDRREDAARARQALFPSPKEPLARAARFLLATPDAAKAIFSALGFAYAFDQQGGAPTHPAAVAVLRDDGRLSEWLPAFADATQLAAALDRARGPGQSTVARALVWCGLADPQNGRYTADVLAGVRLGAAVTAVALFAYVALTFRRRRR